MDFRKKYNIKLQGTIGLVFFKIKKKLYVLFVYLATPHKLQSQTQQTRQQQQKTHRGNSFGVQKTMIERN